MILHAADLMQRSIVTIPASATWRELVDLLDEHGIHGVPVVDASGKPIGVVSRSDIADALSDSDPPDRATHHWYAIGDEEVALDGDETDEAESVKLDVGRTVREIMSPNLITARATATAGDLARKMAKNRVQRLLIVEGRRLVGIVSASDLLRCLSSYEASLLRMDRAKAPAARSSLGR